MGDSFAVFEPDFPETWRFPPGYFVEGIVDEQGVFFYWFRISDNPGEGTFGPNCKTKTEARRGALADHKERCK